MTPTYECVVIGSGLAGSVMALCLARCGVRTLVLEEKSHPRFAIGESTVPTTTLGFDYLARVYDVPELRNVSHYLECKQVGITAWPKQSFWFGHHRPGEEMARGEELLLQSPGLPTGPDCHLLRSEADAYLAAALPRYGVDYRPHTSVVGYEADARGATLKLGGEAGPSEVRARFVVDCSGHASFLARHFQLRQSSPNCRTNTRSIYAHFADVPMLEEVLGNKEPRFITSRDAGTIHHFFEGGWFWCIRFDDGTMSVGLVLDRTVYPDNELSAEQEFRLFVERFPTVRAHLGGMRPTRPLVKTGRMQFSSSTMVGDRFLLTPHAAGFVDPLFSSGIDLTLAFAARAIPAIQQALAADDFSPRRFAVLDQTYAMELDLVDLMVSGLYRSFYHFDVFKQYWRTWVYASVLQYFASLSCPPDSPHGPFGHYGATLADWKQHLRAMHTCVSQSRAQPPRQTAAQLKEMMDSLVEPFEPALSNWEIGSSEVCRPAARTATLQWFRELVPTVPELALRSNPEWLMAFEKREAERKAQMEARYAESRQQGTRFHKDLDMMRWYQTYARR